MLSVSESPVVARVSVSTEERERLVELVLSSHRLQAQQLLKAPGDSPVSSNNILRLCQ